MRLLLVLLLGSAIWAQIGIMRVQRRATGGSGGGSVTVVAATHGHGSTGATAAQSLNIVTGDKLFAAIRYYVGVTYACADVTITWNTTVGSWAGVAGSTVVKSGADECIGWYELQAPFANAAYTASVTTSGQTGPGTDFSLFQVRGLTGSVRDSVGTWAAATTTNPVVTASITTNSGTPAIALAAWVAAPYITSPTTNGCLGVTGTEANNSRSTNTVALYTILASQTTGTCSMGFQFSIKAINSIVTFH